MSTEFENVMINDENQTFLTALPDDRKFHSIVINEDDDIDIDVKSSTDSQETLLGKDEFEDILEQKQSQEFSSILITNQPINDALQDKMSHDDPSPSTIGEHLQPIISQAVYDYAAMVHENLESPHQNKLDHDVHMVLGSSDPPPGFGFLHPRFYYLEQKRPVPMEPLRVWRGYNGHVYFSPIQVQQLDSDRSIEPTKPRKSTGAIRTNTAATLITNKTIRSRTVASNFRTTKERFQPEPINQNRKIFIPTTSDDNDLKNNTLVTFPDDEETKDEQDKTKMWRSVVTCVPVQIKPMSKRNEHDIEELHALQQDQLLHDPQGFSRPVLPNIRPVPKSKFLYKGLAYKEVKKIPGINKENDNETNTNTLKKPLIDYNLAQAYVRYEVNAARSKQQQQQQVDSLPKSAVPSKTPLLRKNHTSLDLRETRKRIIKGSTCAAHVLPQTPTWLPGRSDTKTTVNPENFEQRPSTSKSSIPFKQMTIIDMPILTKYVHRPRSVQRLTPTGEFLINT